MTTPVLNEEYFRKVKQSHRTRMAAVDEIIVEVMLVTYETITGQKPTDRFREKIEEAVAYDQ